MRSILWTEQAQADLAAIHTFISHDSVRYADVVVAELIAATDRLALFPESGRAVPEFKILKCARLFVRRIESSTGLSATITSTSLRSITRRENFRRRYKSSTPRVRRRDWD